MKLLPIVWLNRIFHFS